MIKPLLEGILVAFTLALFVSLVARADTTITVGGVTWHTEQTTQLNSGTTAMQGQDGYGRIDFLNFVAQVDFCPGCELTFVWEAYEPEVVGNPSGFDEYRGGVMTFYVDRSPDFSLLSRASAGPDADTSVWLQLEGYPVEVFGHQITSPNSTRVDVPDFLGRAVYGLFSVIGGTAAPHFDSNLIYEGADMLMHGDVVNFRQFVLGTAMFRAETE